MEENFTTGGPKTPWKLEETERGHLKFGGVGDMYSGVLDCGELCAAVTGCSLGWLNAQVSCCRAHVTVCKQHAHSKLW